MDSAKTHHGQVIALLKDHFGDSTFLGIEIGTRAADLTKSLLSQIPNLSKLYTVDPWLHDEKNLFEAGHPQAEHDEVRVHAFKALEEFGERVEIMRMKSDEAFDKTEFMVDFVWIDGDHTIEAVVKDINNAKLVVRKGGIIGGHDHNTVLEALEQTMLGKEVFQGADQTWWVYV